MTEQENFEKEMEELKEQIDNAPKEETPLDEHIQQMAYLWDKVHEKLRKDNICFHTKKPLIAEGQDPKDVKIHILEANQIEPGIAAFVSISEEAMKQLQEDHSKKLEEQEKVSEEK